MIQGINAAGNDTGLVGIWKGVIVSPIAEVELYWRFSINEECISEVFYDCPLYGIKDVPVTTVTVNQDSIFLDISLFPSTFYGLIHDDSMVIEGFYSGEGDGVTPFTLKKIKDDPRALLPYMKPRLSVDEKQEYSYQYEVPEFIEGGWKTGNIADFGLDSTRIQQFSEQVLEEKYPNLHSMLIIKDDVLVYEEYFYGHDRDDAHHIYSNGKGLTSLSIGIAIEEGLIGSLDTPIYKYFPEYSVLKEDSDKKNITVEHLLNNTAGFEWDETSTSYYDKRNSNRQMMNSKDQLEFLFTRPLSHTPGTHFTYNSGIPNVLNILLFRETGIPAWTFMEEKIFKPMEFENYTWDIQSDGKLHGNFLRPRDFAKLAKLYLNKGRWEDTQIIDSTWFDNCYKVGKECTGYEYWNHWGKGKLFVDGIPVVKYSGGGFGGQAIIGFPDLDLIVVFTGGNYFTTSVNHDEILQKYVLPPLVKKGSGYDIPDYSLSPGFKALHGLEFKDTFFTGLGALWGCLDYLEADLNEAWIYGISGTAFALNAHPKMYANCLGRWDNDALKDQIEEAGYKYSTVAVYIGNEKFEEYQELGWNRVREAIDNGYPAYGFHMNLPENYVIYGYDDFGYYFKGPECKNGYGPICWNKVARNDVGWFEVHTLEPLDSTVDKSALVKKALETAVSMNIDSNDYAHRGYVFGISAYTTWKDILESGDADWFGVAYNASGWATCRDHAFRFLEECKDYVPLKAQKDLAESISNYERVSVCWNALSDLFPYEGQERWQLIENWEDDYSRQQALNLIKIAEMFEKEGIKNLQAVLSYYE